ncbi:DMT family transporter [Candidatus Woesearchaeota archaeon]|nr:DMT family transporter [Candidatus Woesearchaeota archaeon]
MPPAELFAIGSAIAFALTNVTVRNALRKFSSPFTALLTVSSAMVVLWLVVLLQGLEIPSTAPALALFAIRGILDPGISALLIFIALRRIGVAVTVPIIAASPFVSTTLSVIFLNESLTTAIISGTLLIIAGVVLLTLKQGKVTSSLKYVLMAVAGSAAIGAAAVATKLALNISNTPVSGMASAFTSALLFQLIVIAWLGKWKEVPLSLKAAKWFVIAGMFAAAAFTLMFLAIGLGKVSVVFPLLSTQPLFALILSFVLLRQQERITRNVILGTAAIVAGAALLSVV